MFWELCLATPWREHKTFEAIIIEVDSTTAISMATKQEGSSRTKHISIKFHRIRELIARGVFQLRFVRSEEQVADALSKRLFHHLRYKALRVVSDVGHFKFSFVLTLMACIPMPLLTTLTLVPYGTRKHNLFLSATLTSPAS